MDIKEIEKKYELMKDISFDEERVFSLDEGYVLLSTIKSLQTPVDDEVLEGTLVSLELNRPITDAQYFNLKNMIRDFRSLTAERDKYKEALEKLSFMEVAQSALKE